MECPSIIPRTSLKKCRASSVIRSAAWSECDGGGGDRAPVARPSTPRGDATAIVANLWTMSCEGRWSQRLGGLEGKLIAADLLVVDGWIFWAFSRAPANASEAGLLSFIARHFYGTSICPRRGVMVAKKDLPRKDIHIHLSHNSPHIKNTKHIPPYPHLYLNNMMNNAETPERPMRPADMPATMAAPDAAAAFRFPSSSAPVTPSPYVNRAGHSDVKFASPVAAGAKGKRLDFVESKPKRQHDQTYNDDEDAEAEEASDQNKKAKISNKIPPKEDKMQTFRALTVFPTNEAMSSDDRNKAASHLRNTCLAPDLLRLKTNDRIVTAQKLGDNVPVGTPGKVVGWTSIEDIRCGLSNHIQELREMKKPANTMNSSSWAT